MNLTEDTDSISWRLTTDGCYSVTSAYHVQILGRLDQPNLDKVWKIRAEGKVKFFLWLALQNRNWTAEKRRDRGLAHCDNCSLCDQNLETASHLALACPFAREVWHCFQTTDLAAVQLAAAFSSLGDWWSAAGAGKFDQMKHRQITLSVYIIWHIWKERGRRVFQNESLLALAVPHSFVLIFSCWPLLGVPSLLLEVVAALPWACVYMLY